MKFTYQVKNRTRNFEHIPDVRRRIRRVFDELDSTHFQYLVVFVAGAGFFTDGYEIFAASLAVPILAHTYWDGTMPSTLEWTLNIAVLAGTVLGQLGFGILADVYGRQRMYGLELLIIIVSVVGLTMASNGASDSMHLVGWLVTWRFLLGIGIGGDYPLSAVITSEFAPTKHRSRMLASVFFMQPCGYLVATVVSIIAMAGYRDDITLSVQPLTPDSLTCSQIDHCQRALDQVWRWLVGLGAVPALVAIVLRFTIPESPRYTMEVLNRPDEALQDVQEMELPGAISLSSLNLNGNANANDLEMQPQTGDPSASVSPPQLPGPEGTLPRRASFGPPAPPPRIRSDIMNLPPTPRIRSMGLDGKPPSAWAIYRSGLKEHFITKGYWLTLLGTSLTWASFDFAFYVLGPISYEVVAKTFNESNLPEQEKSIYLDLLENSWHSLVIVSIGSMVGGLAMIYLVQPFSSRKIQMFGFLILTVLFITIGLLFELLDRGTSVPLMVCLYILAQIFFEIGPNFTTYIIPAELFPTHYRCTGHGVSAASGKVAAVLVQVFVSFTAIGPYKVSDNGVQWFGYVIIIFAAFMICGGVATKCMIPEIRNPDGSPRPLEELQYIGKTKVCNRRTRSPPHPLPISAEESDNNISSANGTTAPQ
ncbi:Major facilitator superfamily domain containing protein [Elaphomyces granulatus]